MTSPDPAKKPRVTRIVVKDLIITFFCPMILGKILVLYFGQNYTLYPGEGYGIGLGLAIAFTVGMLARFVWRYRHYSEDEER